MSLCLYDCDENNPNQQWLYKGAVQGGKPGTIWLESSPEPHLCMDVESGNWAEGTRIQAWECNGVDNNQKWAFRYNQF